MKITKYKSIYNIIYLRMREQGRTDGGGGGGRRAGERERMLMCPWQGASRGLPYWVSGDRFGACRSVIACQLLGNLDWIPFLYTSHLLEKIHGSLHPPGVCIWAPIQSGRFWAVTHILPLQQMSLCFHRTLRRLCAI